MGVDIEISRPFQEPKADGVFLSTPIEPSERPLGKVEKGARLPGVGLC